MADDLGELVLACRGSAEDGAFDHLVTYSGHYRWVGMAMDQRGVVVEKVNVAVPIAIEDVRTLASGDVSRVWGIVNGCTGIPAREIAPSPFIVCS
jgi:hypothetical protein